MTIPSTSGATGGGSFSDGVSNPQTIYTEIAHQPWYPLQLSQNVGSFLDLLWLAFKGKLPNNAIAVVVYLNGDVAKFQVINPSEVNACCTYIAGTARNKFGVFINDKNLGGTGKMSGGNYVNTGPNGTVIIGTSTTVHYSCVKVSNGSWYCETVMQ